ncbi:MAG: esterase-like activity of phytase family protein, partial [Thermosynechococcaceae cyanobacterium]
MDANFDTFQPAQADGLEGYTVDPIVTIGESIDDYIPAGIPDGMGAFKLDDNTVRILVNHELRPDVGYAYQLANGTELTGARVSYFDIDKTTRDIKDAGLAYDTIVNRAGETVDEVTDLENSGLSRLCSAHYIEAGQFGKGQGLVDGLFFTGEEGSGGTEFVLDPTSNTLYAAPWMGRAAWENVTELDTGTTDNVAFLVGDDREGAPLLMYVGTKDTSAGAGVLERNGLVGGQLYVWATDNGDTTPEQFNGTFESRDGRWVEIPIYDPAQAGTAASQDELGYDAQGFATQAQQDALTEAVGAFQFSRPEDVATNPADGTQAVLNSTGRDSLFPSDSWGTTYIIDTDFGADGTPVTASVKAIYDGDDAGAGQFTGSDFGLRSPDNLDWSDDGNIYIQEDRSFSEFGLTSGEEASIWKLNPESGELTRIAQIDRAAVPTGQTDGSPADIGNWESSGILDVSELFDQEAGSLFIYNTQAHSLAGGVVDSENLAEGGQIAFLSRPAELEGFASLPSDTFAEGPPAGGDNGSGGPIDANGRTGPFDGQPIQGFSGVQFADSDGSFWFLSDNGFGGQDNSSDYLLRLYKADPSFAGSEGGDSSVAIEDFIQLSDPNGLVGFDIQNEGTTERLLTGSDFDVESFVIDGNGEIWVGEEFGPYLLHFDATGTLLDAPIPTPNLVELNTLNGQNPIVIGHRGASGVLPEHTLEAYRVAIAQDADFIEPDLVSTKDGVLIARHEPILDDTTNVADVFGSERMSTKVLDGVETTAYFAEDFTLEEIKMLRALQSRDFRSQDFNGAFEIPTFKEIIELVQEVEAQTGKAVGIYPETKHPTFFDLQGLSLEENLIATLQETGFTDPNRLFIQSFEFQNLIELQGLLDAEGLGEIPLVQLYGDATASANSGDTFSVPYDIRYNVEQGNDLAAIYGQDFLDAAENALSADTVYSDLDSAEFLQIISAKYAEGAGPWKNNFLLRESLATPVDGNGDGVAEITSQLTGEVTSFVDDAHAAGLQVHPYTLRNEEQFLTLNADGTPQTAEDEIKQLIEIGVDGFFTDFSNTGDQVRDLLVADQVRSPQNPEVQSGDAVANLAGSRGFEGMAISPDRQTLYPLLEGTVEGDPEGSLRIYKFDVASSEYQGLVGRYQLDDPSHAIGDFSVINENEYLVIERDSNQGEEAAFKKIFKVDLSQVDENGNVLKEELVDLLNIRDPNDLNGDGSTSFKFPFVTIEDVLVVDADTLLIANDNNYPFSVGRGPDIDNNEIIQVKLDQPLNLDARVGQAGLSRFGVSGTAFDTVEPAQVKGLEDYVVDPVFTIGETYGDYTPAGILDGLGAFALDDNTVRVLANHELRETEGYAYQLANGTELTGARVSYFDIDKTSRAVVGTGLAYDTIINRVGDVVDEASDLEFGGLSRLCSAHYIEAGQFGEGRGLVDGLFFTGEEGSGGTEFVLDPSSNTLYAAPWMGRAAWENVTELDTGTDDKVALLIGDDRQGAPLTLYVGTKETSAGADVLERNGLVGGQLFVWASDSGETTPEEFNGTFESRSGSWVEIPFYDLNQAGTAANQDELGYDAQGFATQAQQDALAEAVGAFKFSRPEDVATNPKDGTQAVLASTGRDSLFPSDSWGTTYIIDTDFGVDGTPITASVKAIYDGDDAGASQFEGSDFGLRSPDNLDWSADGNIYIQEDRSIGEFGLTSGEETSIWRLDPVSGELTRVAQVDRSAVPLGQTDGEPTDIGNWETSGILDVSELFGEEAGSLLLFDVQAHSLGNGVIDAENLVQGGQLAFLEVPDLEDPFNEVIGSNRSERLLGSKGADLIQGLSGSDTIKGFAGDDTIEGGNGADVIDGGPGANVINGGNGHDSIRGGNDSDTIDGGSDRDTLIGARGNDLITGGAGADLIDGSAGDDLIDGGDGRDTIEGGIGSDTIEGGSGADLISGGGGHDTLMGGDGRDTLTGERGDDLLMGGAGGDHIEGGQGKDTLIGGAGRDTLYGGTDRDLFVLEVGQGQDVIQDYQVRWDALGLSEGLTVAQLGVSQRDDSTLIKLLETNQTLAVLDGVSAALGELSFQTYTPVV